MSSICPCFSFSLSLPIRLRIPFDACPSNRLSAGHAIRYFDCFQHCFSRCLSQFVHLSQSLYLFQSTLSINLSFYLPLPYSLSFWMHIQSLRRIIITRKIHLEVDKGT